MTRNITTIIATWMAIACTAATPDPLAAKFPSLSPYNHCANNPLSVIDPTGEYIESLWDAANIGLGISSLWSNIQNGNVGDAVVDGLGLAVDVAAIILPGGASSAINTSI